MNNLPDIPNYTLIREIGEGGMGTVYLAIDNILQRQVAVKALKPGLSLREESMKRFQSEAVTLARLRHPNITVLYNLIQHRDYWCMVMEYVEGETLESLLGKQGTLPLKEVLHILIQTLEGLRHAHAKGVVHRDLKPANLMLSSDGEVKIMDFGIARMAGNSRLTRAGQAAGTPQYMSPEQVQGQEGDAASDIYSLGVVLYELLTGATPFAGENEFEIMQAHTGRKPVPPASLNPVIPDALNSAIMKSLSKKPSQRFAGAGEFKQCLEQIAIPDAAAVPSSAPAFPLSWSRWIRTVPDAVAQWKLPLKTDRQSLIGFGFLAVSIFIACLILFPHSPELPPSEPLAQAPPQEQTPVIEVETETNMETLMSSAPLPVTGQRPTDGNMGGGNGKVKPPPSPAKKKNTPPPPAETGKKGEEKENKPQSPPPETQPATGRATAEVEPQPKVTQQVTPPSSPPVTAPLNKVVVIPRGIQVDVLLDQSYDYDSAPNEMRVTLSVASKIVCSGETVIASGAKAYALLRKNMQRRELTLRILEVESITGEVLRVLNTTYRGASFPKGKMFKMNLEYNRIGR